MYIREYKADDCDRVAQIFFETVHSVNAKDYTQSQLFAWAVSADDFKIRRQEDLLSQNTIVAEIGGVIVGFGSIDQSGCFDLLFVDKDYQGQGIATALCDMLEKPFDSVVTFASITAKPFFECRGYVAIKAQEVERNGEVLKNYIMQKSLIQV